MTQGFAFRNVNFDALLKWVVLRVIPGNDHRAILEKPWVIQHVVLLAKKAFFIHCSMRSSVI